jgi:hypothetical protein
LGTFPSEVDAARNYDLSARYLGFETGLNFPHLNYSELPSRDVPEWVIEGVKKRGTSASHSAASSSTSGVGFAGDAASNTTSFHGVIFDSCGGQYPWNARVSFDFHEISIGFFASAVEAARMHDFVASSLLGDKARLNTTRLPPLVPVVGGKGDDAAAGAANGVAPIAPNVAAAVAAAAAASASPGNEVTEAAAATTEPQAATVSSSSSSSAPPPPPPPPPSLPLQPTSEASDAQARTIAALTSLYERLKTCLGLDGVKESEQPNQGTSSSSTSMDIQTSTTMPTNKKKRFQDMDASNKATSASAAAANAKASSASNHHKKKAKMSSSTTNHTFTGDAAQQGEWMVEQQQQDQSTDDLTVRATEALTMMLLSLRDGDRADKW